MSFGDFFEDCKDPNKSISCPDGCGFKEKPDIPASWIPPPQGHPFVGIIISRDPTTAFIPFYNEAKDMNLAEWREHLFHCNAIPDWTFNKIERFSR